MRAIEELQRAAFPPSLRRQIQEAGTAGLAAALSPLHDVIEQARTDALGPLQDTIVQARSTALAPLFKSLQTVSDESTRGLQGITEALRLFVSLNADRHLSFTALGSQSASRGESVRRLMDSFSERLAETDADSGSGLARAFETATEDEGEDTVGVNLEIDPDADAFANAFLDFVGQEAPQVAEAIEYAAANASTPLDASAGRRILATAVASLVFTLAIAGVVLPPPWSVFAVVILATTQAAELGSKAMGPRPDGQ